MPQLYGLPAGQPTTTRAAGQSGQQGGGGLDIDTAMTDLLSRLQLPQEQPVQPTSLPKKILAGLADALMVRAQTLAGQAPTGAGARDRQRQEEESQKQANQKTAEGNRQVRNEVVTSLYSQKLSEERSRQQAVFQEGLDRETARQNDVRDAEIRDKDRVASAALEYAKAGGVLPPGFKLSDQTSESMIGIISTGLQSDGVEKKLADSMARALLLVGQNPNLQIDDVDVSTGKVSLGPKPKEPRDPVSRGGREMTRSGMNPEFLARKSQELGEDLTNLSIEEVNSKLAAFGKERLRWVKLSAAEAEELATYDELIEGSKELLDQITETGVGGAENFFFATSNEAAAFRAKALQYRDVMERARTGATTNPRDTSTYDILYAAMGNLTRNNIAALVEAERFFTRIADKRLNYRLVPESQRRAMRQFRASGASPEDSMPEVPDDLVEAP